MTVVTQQDELIMNFLSFLVMYFYDKSFTHDPIIQKKGVVLIDNGASQ